LMTQRGRTSASSSIFSTGRADRCGGMTQLRGGGGGTQQKKEEDSAGILEQSMGARNRVGIELSYRPAGLCSPGWPEWKSYFYSVPNPPLIVLKFQHRAQICKPN
jgi:hypothetical protein